MKFGARTVRLTILAVVFESNLPGLNALGEEASTPAPVSVEQARREVKMLDDLYKTTIVLVTKTYVEDEGSTAAIVAAQALWDAMKAKGWHEARLVDATGEPCDADNEAKSEFEKQSIGKLSADAPYFDKVVERDGKKFLEAMTYVPMVMEKCTMCHDNYKNIPAGKAVGAVSYRIPVK